MRVLFATDSSGHTAGSYVVSRALRDAGIEVIVTEPRLPEEIAETALQEDADLVALRIMDRDPVDFVGALLAAMRTRGIERIPLLAGGIIGKAEAAKLRETGVRGVFGPGSKLSAIVECARQAVAEKEGS